MAKNSNYVVKYRRRRENKTNYKKRLKLLKSEKLRFIVRFTNRYVITQISKYEPEGDKVIAHANSKELSGFGWKYGTKNTPAAYLTALLCGSRVANKENNIIFDIGLKTSIKKSKIYSALKGAIDAGLIIPHSEDIFPDESRIRGEHINQEISSDFEMVKNNIKNSIDKQPKQE